MSQNKMWRSIGIRSVQTEYERNGGYYDNNKQNDRQDFKVDAWHRISTGGYLRTGCLRVLVSSARNSGQYEEIR